jgi:hypothetical protein
MEKESLYKLSEYIELSLKDLETKESLQALKRTKDLDQIITRTISTISKAKQSILSLTDSQIFGRDN